MTMKARYSQIKKPYNFRVWFKDPCANIMDELDGEIANPEYTQREYSMFILIVLTHGDTGGVLYNPDSSITHLNDIYRKLSPDKFKHFEGKPKLVIVQACSGTGDIIMFDPAFMLCCILALNNLSVLY